MRLLEELVWRNGGERFEDKDHLLEQNIRLAYPLDNEYESLTPKQLHAFDGLASLLVDKSDPQDVRADGEVEYVNRLLFDDLIDKGIVGRTFGDDPVIRSHLFTIATYSKEDMQYFKEHTVKTHEGAQ